MSFKPSNNGGFGAACNYIYFVFIELELDISALQYSFFSQKDTHIWNCENSLTNNVTSYSFLIIFCSEQINMFQIHIVNVKLIIMTSRHSLLSGGHMYFYSQYMLCHEWISTICTLIYKYDLQCVAGLLQRT